MRFLAADGTVLGTEQRPGCAFNWLGAYGPDIDTGRVATVEVHAVLRAAEAGTYTVARLRRRPLPAERGRRRGFDERDLQLRARAPTSSRR